MINLYYYVNYTWCYKDFFARLQIFKVFRIFIPLKCFNQTHFNVQWFIIFTVYLLRKNIHPFFKGHSSQRETFRSYKINLTLNGKAFSPLLYQ